MNIVGIIAEYNPLHRGHIHQLRLAKELTGADACVVVMSGNFVQRGEPAILDKYRRTSMALASGADAVLELPLSCSTGSGERFADGAVGALHALGCVNALSYGCESPSHPLWEETAQLLAYEPREFRELLKKHLSTGIGFPAARALAMETLIPGSAELLSSPNNILALEYRKAILRRPDCRIRTVPVPRTGSGYHESALPSGDTAASATAIRLALKELPALLPEDLSPVLGDHMTPECQKEFTYQIRPDDLTPALRYALLFADEESLNQIQDMTPDLTNRLLRIRKEQPYLSFSGLGEALKTRNITRTHVNRALLHIILQVRKEEKTPQAFRLLGFRKDSRVMRTIQDHTAIPVVTRMADAPPGAFTDEIRASQFYNQLVLEHTGITIPDEIRHGVVIR